jgi:NADPH:quinone reductase
MLMHAVILETPLSGLDRITIDRAERKPVPGLGEVLLHVVSFGMDPSDSHLRNRAPDIYHQVANIEAVGYVEECPGMEFAAGERVACIKRTSANAKWDISGAYLTARASSVLPLRWESSWADLEASPEAWAVAQSCLFIGLEVEKDHRILIRGASTAVGNAAVRIAMSHGAIVTATVHESWEFDRLHEIGPFEVQLESSGVELMAGRPPHEKFDRILNLVDHPALHESKHLTRPGGRILQAGWIDGASELRLSDENAPPTNGVHFILFDSSVLKTPGEMPVSRTIQDMIEEIERLGSSPADSPEGTTSRSGELAD